MEENLFEENGKGFWSARDLYPLLGYVKIVAQNGDPRKVEIANAQTYLMLK